MLVQSHLYRKKIKSFSCSQMHAMLHSPIYNELGNTSSAMSPPNLQSIIFTSAKHPSTMKLNFCNVNVPKKFTIYKRTVCCIFPPFKPLPVFDMVLPNCWWHVSLFVAEFWTSHSAVSLSMLNFPKGPGGFWNQHLRTAIPVHVCPGSLKNVFKILVKI